VLFASEETRTRQGFGHALPSHMLAGLSGMEIVTESLPELILGETHT
jgi:hypothetical protein